MVSEVNRRAHQRMRSRASSRTRTARRMAADARPQGAGHRGRSRPGSSSSTYQAASGAGLAGGEELLEQVARSASSRTIASACVHDGSARRRCPRRHKFPQPIAFNVVPLAGDLVDDGLNETVEEQKLRNESRKILELPDLPISGDLRARPGLHRPLARGERRVRAADQPERARELLTDAPRRRARGGADPAARRPAADPTFVGRIRQDEGVPDGRGLAMFISNDNLRKGARAERRADRGARRRRPRTPSRSRRQKPEFWWASACGYD